MPIVQPPKTIEDFDAIRATITGLLGNPYCDQFMFMRLSDKLKNVDAEILKLKQSQDGENKEKELA